MPLPLTRRRLLSASQRGLLGVVASPLLARAAWAATAQQPMLLYCGITMVRPMTEIAALFEKAHGVKVSIAQGGSEDIFQSVRQGKVGDWFLPGEPSYVSAPDRQRLFASRQTVGYNRLALVVKKGNPKRVKPDLRELLRKDLVAVIGNADSGSVGKESRRVLEQLNAYEAVLRAVAFLSPDSRSITNALKRGEADVALNWRATAFFPDNANELQVIDLDPKQSPPLPLVLLRLASSQRPELAQRLLDLAGSESGKAVFRRYGFLDAL